MMYAYIVYGFIDPRSNKIFYVNYRKNLQGVYGHLKSVNGGRLGQQRYHKKIRDILDEGRKAQLKIFLFAPHRRDALKRIDELKKELGIPVK